MKNESEKSGLRTWIEVDRKALASNYKAIRGLLSSKTKLMAVSKSNAYGHSLVDYSREMVNLGVDWLGVDSIVEAVALRKSAVKKPILVLGYTLPEMLALASEHDISIAVSTFETLAAIAKSNFEKPIKIHVKVDTGMTRQGFQNAEIKKVIEEVKKLKSKIIVEGLFTHFAAAKNPAFPRDTQKQLEKFAEWRTEFEIAGYTPIVHAAASGGTIIYPESHFDLVRVGIALYGEWPSPEVEAFGKTKITLKPALTWKTIIGEVKKVKKGERVGYDFTETLSRDSVIAVCPIGYWHGFPRALSSIGDVLVNGKRARVIGRVSMDMITIDVTGISGAKVGSEVVLLGADGKEIVSAEDMARLSGTSSYEIITRLNPLIKRIYK